MSAFRGSFQNGRLHLCLLVSLWLGATLVTSAMIEYELTDSDKRLVVETYNKERKDVNPTAADMRGVNWCTGLEDIAKIYVSTCEFKNPRSELNVSINYFYYRNYTIGDYAAGDFVQHALTYWANVSSQFHHKMIFATTDAVGCAINNCPSLIVTDDPEPRPHLACFTKAVSDEFPYERGTPCSKCPDGWRCSDSLCYEGTKAPNEEAGQDLADDESDSKDNHKPYNSWLEWKKLFWAQTSLVGQTPSSSLSTSSPSSSTSWMKYFPRWLKYFGGDSVPLPATPRQNTLETLIIWSNRARTGGHQNRYDLFPRRHSLMSDLKPLSRWLQDTGVDIATGPVSLRQSSLETLIPWSNRARTGGHQNRYDLFPRRHSLTSDLKPLSRWLQDTGVDIASGPVSPRQSSLESLIPWSNRARTGGHQNRYDLFPSRHSLMPGPYRQRGHPRQMPRFGPQYRQFESLMFPDSSRVPGPSINAWGSDDNSHLGYRSQEGDDASPYGFSGLEDDMNTRESARRVGYGGHGRGVHRGYGGYGGYGGHGRGVHRGYGGYGGHGRGVHRGYGGYGGYGGHGRGVHRGYGGYGGYGGHGRGVHRGYGGYGERGIHGRVESDFW